MHGRPHPRRRRSAPDELLTHLDDLVSHLAAGGAYDGGGTEAAELGATCLYAVYDPVSRRLALAAAGHPAPALLLPDGTTRLVDMTAGPPLGVGGLPFEATELELPEGSVVALYTDGLVEDRDRDVDHATTELCRALAAPRPPWRHCATASSRPCCPRSPVTTSRSCWPAPARWARTGCAPGTSLPTPPEWRPPGGPSANS